MRLRHAGGVLVLAAAAAGAAGCGVQPSGVITGASPPSGEARGAVPVTLYFVSNGRLEPVQRVGPPLAEADTLGQLTAGPTGAERARGLSTAVPADAAPFWVTVDPAGPIVVTVAAEALPAIAADQIVCTVAAMVPTDRARVMLKLQRSSLGPRSCPAQG